jgi:hypothetical protein
MVGMGLLVDWSVGRYVPVLAAADCSDSCLQVCFYFNVVSVTPAMTMSSPEHQSRTDAQTDAQTGMQNAAAVPRPFFLTGFSDFQLV